MSATSSPFKEWQPLDLPYNDFHWVGGEQIVFAREIMGPGGGGPLHRHHTVEELIFVSEGEVAVTIGEETRTLGPGDVAIMPRGIFHGTNTLTGATFYVMFSGTSGALPSDDYERMDGKTAHDPV
jgi:quercetin dioxygenase-like cupin family protein